MQVSRAHSFKKKIEKSDEQLKQYIKSLQVIVEPVPEKQPPQIQIQQPEMIQIPSFPQNQLFQTANGQICQLIQGPNNSIVSKHGTITSELFII